MPRFAANLSLLFTELPFLDRFAAAARAGFRRVECQFPYGEPAAAIADALRSSGLDLVLHNLPAGDWAAGERGIAILPDRTEEYRAGVARAIDYARALGCRQLNCLAGIAPSDEDPRRLDAILRANLSYAAAETAKAGLRLLIEPVNSKDIPGFHVDRSGKALAIIDAVGADNLFLQYDVYHMQVMEGDLARTIAAHKDRVGHIQIADNPGRHEPGSGEINFPFLFAHLDRIGWPGVIGCEYLPASGTQAGLGWLFGPQPLAMDLEDARR